MVDLQHRFGGIQRLYGLEAFEIITQANICVVGIGGVGTWVAEALARSGVGKITLIDMDDVCETNINRQIVALDSTIDEAKVDVMAARIADINPDCEKYNGLAAQARIGSQADPNFLTSVVNEMGGIDIVMDKKPGAAGFTCFKHCYEAGVNFKATGDCLIIAPMFICEKKHIDEIIEKLRTGITNYAKSKKN